MDMTDTDLPLVLNKYMMVSSEKLQQDLPFDQLHICHQYVFIDAYIEFQALLINHTSDILYFRKRQLVGHVEKIQVIQNVNTIKNDDFACYLINQLDILDDKTISVPESRIYNDIPNLSFDLSNVNCLSENKDNKIWPDVLYCRMVCGQTGGKFNPFFFENRGHNFSSENWQN